MFATLQTRGPLAGVGLALTCLALVSRWCGGVHLAAAGQSHSLFDTVAALVTPYGYPLEEHFVTSEDGYVLRMFRIPCGKHSAGSGAPRGAVLVAHGLLDSAEDFLVLGPEKSLGFMLADAGYEVWLPNARGNLYSRMHKWLDTNSLEYWAFSFDEMAQYDLPAIIDHVLDVTHQPQLLYVGYSQGATTAFAALSAQPHLAEKIKAAVMLAPITFLHNSQNLLLRQIAETNGDQLLLLLGYKQFPPAETMLNRVGSLLCGHVPRLCIHTGSPLDFYNPANVDPGTVKAIVRQAVAGTSSQNAQHWAQWHRNPLPKIFPYFDFGSKCRPYLGHAGRCNRNKYGRDTPPRYDLKAVKTPLFFIAGGQDTVADPLDVQDLVDELPAGLVWQQVHVPTYEHLDFVWGKDVGKLVNCHVISFLEAV